MFKKDVEFSEDGETVSYKNYQRFIYDPELSCETCKSNPDLILPNVAALVSPNLRLFQSLDSP